MRNKFLFILISVLSLGLLFSNSYGETFKTHQGRSGYSIGCPDGWSFKSGDANTLWDRLVSADGMSSITIVFGESQVIPSGGDIKDTQLVAKTPEQIFNSEVLGEIAGSSKRYSLLEKTPIFIDGKEAISAVVKVSSAFPESSPYLEKVYVISDDVFYYALYYTATDEKSFQENLNLSDAIIQSFRCIPEEKLLEYKKDAQRDYEEIKEN